MSSSAQFRFAAEFVTFLAAASGLALVLLRAELLSRVSWARLALGAGFAAVGAGAFLHGSLIIESATNPTLLLVDGVGIAALGGATTQWDGERSTRSILWTSLAFLGVALVAEALSRSGLARGGHVAGRDSGWASPPWPPADERSPLASRRARPAPCSWWCSSSRWPCRRSSRPASRPTPNVGCRLALPKRHLSCGTGRPRTAVEEAKRRRPSPSVRPL